MKRQALYDLYFNIHPLYLQKDNYFHIFHTRAAAFNQTLRKFYKEFKKMKLLEKWKSNVGHCKIMIPHIFKIFHEINLFGKMKKLRINLIVILYTTLMPAIVGQIGTGEIVTDSKGKYVLKEHGLIECTYQMEEPIGKNDSSNFAYHNYIPLGSEIEVFNNDNNTSIKAIVKGKLKYANNGVILQLEESAFSKLYKTKYYEYPVKDKPGVVWFVTPIDSLLNLLHNQKDEAKFETYTKLVNYYRHYQPKKALEFAKKKVDLARKMKNLDIEAEAWLYVGHVQMDMVEKESIKLSWSDRPSNPEGLIEKMETKLGYPKEDIVRWNRLGGNFFYLQSLFTYHDNIVIYPKPEQFTDVAFHKYLKIREEQKDTDKIVMALKEIGDLQRLKTGYDSAEVYYLRMLKIRDEGDSDEKKSWIWGYLADFYWEQKNYTETEKYFQKLYALRQSTSFNDPERLIWAIGGLRNLRYTEGKIAEALDLQRQLFPLYKKVNNSRREAILRVIIRDYLEVFSDRQEVVLQSLIEWYTNHAKEDFEKIILAKNIAKVYAERNNFGKAAEFTAVLIPFSEGEAEKIRKINDVAFYYQKDSSFEKSLSYYEKALSITQKSGDKILESIQYYKIAYFYDYQQKTKDANNWYRKVLNTLKLIPSNSILGYTASIDQLQQIIKYQKHKKKWSTYFAEECIRIHKSSYVKNRFEGLLKSIP